MEYPIAPSNSINWPYKLFNRATPLINSPLYWLKFPATMTRPSSKISKESMMPLNPVPVSKAVRFRWGKFYHFGFQWRGIERALCKQTENKNQQRDKRLICFAFLPFLGSWK